MRHNADLSIFNVILPMLAKNHAISRLRQYVIVLNLTIRRVRGAGLAAALRDRFLRGAARQAPYPSTNRGCKMNDTRFSLDWLSFTCFAGLDVLSAILEDWNLGSSLAWLQHGGNGFQHVGKTDTGITVYIHPVNNPQHEYFLIQLPSAGLHAIGIQHIMRVMDGLLRRFKVNVTRLDLAADHKQFTPKQFWRYLEDCIDDDISDAELITRIRRENIRRITDLAGAGDTVYMGARDSAAMLRVYLKQIENDELFNNDKFCRVELELHDARATMALWKLLMSKPEQWQEHYIELLNGLFRISWSIWNDWLNSSARFWLRLVKFRPSIERATKWIDKQVAPTLAMVVGAAVKQFQHNNQGFSPDEIQEIVCNNIVTSGMKRMKDHQQRIVKAAGRRSEGLTLRRGSVLLSDGRPFDDAVRAAVEFLKVPAGEQVLEYASDWLKKQFYYMHQLNLPGVNWDGYIKEHNSYMSDVGNIT